MILIMQSVLHNLEPVNKTARSWHCLQKSFASPPRFSSTISQRRCARPCLFLLAGSFACRLPGFKEISLWQRSMDAPYVNPSEPFPIAAAVAAGMVVLLFGLIIFVVSLMKKHRRQNPTPLGAAEMGMAAGRGAPLKIVTVSLTPKVIEPPEPQSRADGSTIYVSTPSTQRPGTPSTQRTSAVLGTLGPLTLTWTPSRLERSLTLEALRRQHWAHRTQWERCPLGINGWTSNPARYIRLCFILKYSESR
ncbi:hypothetical protein B0H14DRAFT_2611401 [Mycena olivaceomarginata]|nr:hypothetical protein B0H14DRAFT_2611401 [Mycena olivaceomarginata]